MTPDDAVRVRDLRKDYGGAPALSGVSFEIARGETFALLGPNGAGKSTTIEILEGYRDRSGGEASVLEQMRAALRSTITLPEAAEALSVALVCKLARSMMMEVEYPDPARPANAYGVDSLVAVEVRTWAFKEAKSDVSVFDILSNAPLGSLAAKIAANSPLLPADICGNISRYMHIVSRQAASMRMAIRVGESA